MAGGARPSVCGVVLAGVHRWQNAPFDDALPRPLVPVAGAPLISYPLRWLVEGGISQAVICANSASRAVRRRLRDGAGLSMRLDYFEDWTPRGPAGCARDAAIVAGSDLIVIVEGTILPQLDLVDLLATHQRTGAALTVAVHHDRGGSFGASDSPVPSGVYVARRRALEYVPETGYQDIKEMLIPRLHRVGEQVGTYNAADPSPRISNLVTYVAVNAWILERMAQHGAERQIDVSASVSNEALLVGPVVIGARARIAAGVTLVGPIIVGNDCSIEPGSVISRSVIWDGCTIGANSVLDHCVLTNHSQIAANTRGSDHCYSAPRARSAGRARSSGRTRGVRNESKPLPPLEAIAAPSSLVRLNDNSTQARQLVGAGRERQQL